jgi:hypothetical protein
MGYYYGELDRFEDDGYFDEPAQYDDLDTDCIGECCLFAGEHDRYECFTAEDCERMHEEAFWSQYPEIETLIRHSFWSLDQRINRLRDEVLGSYRVIFAEARVACGLTAESCEQCHETLHAGFCADIPF